MLRRGPGPQGAVQGGEKRRKHQLPLHVSLRGFRDGCAKRWMAKGRGARLQAGARQRGPEQCKKVQEGVCGARQPSSRRQCQGQGNGIPLFPTGVRASAAAPSQRGRAAGCSAAELRGAEAVLSPVIDGMVQEEINSQAFAGGELGGVSILKILNECATARGVAADTSLQPALPTLFLARFRHNLTASY